MDNCEIKDYPNYLIYNDGRVFNKKKKKFLNSNQRYKSVSLYNGKICRIFNIHYLVAKYFVDNPHNHNEIDHVDRNKHNNNHTNLRWTNRSINNLNRGNLKNNKINEKNISIKEGREKKFRYNKCINKIKYEKFFYTLEEAIEYREYINKNIVDIYINENGN